MGERREHPSIDTAMTYSADISSENFVSKDIPVPPGETTNTQQEVFMRLVNRRRMTSLDPEIYPSIKSDCEYDTTHIMVTARLASQWTASILIPELRRFTDYLRGPTGPYRSRPETLSNDNISKKIDELTANFDSSLRSIVDDPSIGNQGEAAPPPATLTMILAEIRALSEEIKTAPLLKELQDLLAELSPILKFYADLESTRIFDYDTSVIGHANQVFDKADAEALARRIANILEEERDVNAPWYDRKFVKISLQAWCLLITHLITIIIVIFN